MKEKRAINPAALGALARGDIENYLVASTAGGIEAQEAQGQRSFVESETLPVSVDGHEYGGDAALADMGFELGPEVADDPIFRYAKLPDGWKKEPAEHSMWSKIVDETGRERISIFYKAAFYDRRAEMYIRKTEAPE